LNAEQLNSARLARWSQNGEARLTQEAAAEWLQTIGFCTYLPLGPNGVAPTASFLEAIVGRPAQSPSAGERTRATELLARLIENSSAVPLKFGASLGEQPDFVASAEALRYIYALRGDRNFKTGPSTAGNDKVTTLAQHCWDALQQHGPLDVPALQPILGRDITEAAIARALQELWTALYVFPILSVHGAPARWELLARRFPQQVAAGASTGHAEAQSAMISLYLHATVAALEEEIFAFLSPLASQSKLREVVRGLGSMRQLDILDIEGRSHVSLQGGLLPEMVAQLSEEQLGVLPSDMQIVIEAAPPESGRGPTRDASREPQRPWRPRPQDDSDGPKRFVPKKFVRKDAGSKEFSPRKFAASSASGEAAPRRFAIRASEGGASAGSGGHARGRSDERSGPRSGGRSGPGGRTGAGGPSRFTGSRSAGAYPPRPRSFAPRDGESSGEKKAPRTDATGKPATRGLGERAKRWEKSGEGAGGRPAERRTFAPRATGSKTTGFKSSGFKPAGSKPWASKGGSSRPSFKDRPSKPWTPRASGGPGSSRFSTRDEGDQRGGERAGEERPKRWEKSGEGASTRPAARKPSGYTSSGFKSAGSRSADARSAGAKPFAGKSFGAKPFGKKSFDSKPGGFKPAGAKPWATKAGASDGDDFKGPYKAAASKGASSRVGSARSYAARNADGPAPRGGARPYGKTGAAGKTGGAKSGAKRASSTGEAGDRPKRRTSADSSAGDKGGAKPFWAKNPRGGKGSTAAGRTNRPHGKKAGKKK